MPDSAPPTPLASPNGRTAASPAVAVAIPMAPAVTVGTELPTRTPTHATHGHQGQGVSPAVIAAVPLDMPHHVHDGPSVNPLRVPSLQPIHRQMLQPAGIVFRRGGLEYANARCLDGDHTSRMGTVPPREHRYLDPTGGTPALVGREGPQLPTLETFAGADHGIAIACSTKRKSLSPGSSCGSTGSRFNPCEYNEEPNVNFPSFFPTLERLRNTRALPGSLPSQACTKDAKRLSSTIESTMVASDVGPTAVHVAAEEATTVVNPGPNISIRSLQQSNGIKPKSRIKATTFLSLVMYIGVLLVGSIGVLCPYLILSSALLRSVTQLENDALNGIATSVNLSIMQLPIIAHTVTSHYFYSMEEDMNPINGSREFLSLKMSSMLQQFRGQVMQSLYLGEDAFLLKAEDRARAFYGAHTNATATALPRPIDMRQLQYSTNPPIGPNKSISVESEQLRPTSSYNTVLKRWLLTRRTSKPTTQRWNPSDIVHSGYYLSYCIPWILDSTAVVFQMDFSTQRIRKDMQQLLPTLRQNGRFMLYDSVRDIVVATSWGDKNTIEVANTTSPLQYAPQTINDITDPIMRDATQSFDLYMRKPNVAFSPEVFTRSYATGKQRGTVHITRLGDNAGIDLYAIATSLTNDFYGDVQAVLTPICIYVAITIHLFAAVVFVGVFVIIRPLGQLVPALQLASTLRVVHAEKPTVGSLIREISVIQEAHARLVEQLLLLRSFVPDPVLACMESEAIANPGALMSNADAATESESGVVHPRLKQLFAVSPPNDLFSQPPDPITSKTPPPVNQRPMDLGNRVPLQTISTEFRLALPSLKNNADIDDLVKPKPQREERTGDDTEMEYVASSCGLSVSASPGALQSIREGPQLSYATTHVTPCTNPSSESDCGIFHERLNSFTSTYCTVMTIDSVWEPSQPATALTEFFEAIVACVAEHNGCIEALRPDRTVVSFGAHAPLPMHASKACACALAIYARLSQHKRDGVVMTIDSSEFLVGTCGAHARNARVLFGILHFHAVSRVLRRISCHVGAMMGTATHLQELQLYPIDCVQVPQSVVPTVVYELRTTPSGDREARQRARLTYNHFRHGLSAMRQGNYTLARSHFRQLDPSDGQAARLLAICERCIDTDSAQPYVVRIGETYEVRTTGSTPAAGACTSLATLSMTAPTEHNTIMRRSSSVGTGEFHSGLQHRVTAATDQAEHEASVGAGASRREGGAAEEGTVVGLPASAPQPPETLFDPEYSPLFELMAPSESSDSVSVHDGDDSGVPLVLTDNNGKRWSRSLRNFSEGAFSVVYLGMSESGEQVALKCIPRRRRDISQASLAAELEMASRLRHANIVRYVSYCETPGHLTLVMEYVPGGSLAGVIGSFGRLTATAARRFVTDVLRGLHYLHSRGIVHCDVKPHNVLLGMDGVCKLSDFGSTVSEAADAARVGTDDVVLRGTALYMAPEVARGERCTSQSDIYSLGVSLLEMLTGQPPWGWTAAAVAAAAAGSEDVGGSAEQLHLLMRRDVMFARALGRGEVAPVVPDTLSPDVAGFVRACCQEDPARRPTALQLQSFPFVL